MRTSEEGDGIVQAAHLVSPPQTPSSPWSSSRAAKRTSSGAQLEMDGDDLADETITADAVASGSSSSLVGQARRRLSPQKPSSARRLSAEIVSSSTRTLPPSSPLHHGGQVNQQSDRRQPMTEREAVLDEARSQQLRHKRSRIRRPSLPSDDDEDDPSSRDRSRTPSPILGDVYSYAGAASRPGHIGAPMVGPSTADIQSLLYEKGERTDSSSNRSPPLVDSEEITAIIAQVDAMGFKDDEETSAVGQGKERELAAMVRKLARHAQDQNDFIQTMEESLHNTRVTAVSVISSLTATHAYELAQEKQLRDRLTVDLEGTQASAKKLSSLLAKSQNRREEMDREGAAIVEEEMKWAASLPGTGHKRPSAVAIAAANAMSPRQQAPQNQQQQVAMSPTPGGATARNAVTPSPSRGQDAKAEATTGLGIIGPSTPSHNEYVSSLSSTQSQAGLNSRPIADLPASRSSTAPQTEVFDSPISAVISDRNKLMADKRYLRQRVRDAEAQLHRLENELKALRPLLVQGGARAWLASGSSTAGPSVPATPSSSAAVQQTPGSKGRKDRDRSRRRKVATMGDAESEHLLLAARRLNHVRAQAGASMPPFSETSPLKPSSARFVGERPKTPPMPPLPFTPGGFPRTPGSVAQTPSRTPRSVGKGRAGLMESAVLNSGANQEGPPGPTIPSATASGSPQAKHKALFGSHQRLESNASNASHGGMDELLQAAQSVLTPSERLAAARQRDAAQNNGTYFPPSPSTSKIEGAAADEALPNAMDSPKRRRMSSTEQERARIMSASPHQRHTNPLHRHSVANVGNSLAAFASSNNGAGRLRTRTEGAELTTSPMPSYSGLRAPLEGDEDAASGGVLSALDLLADQAAASQNPSQSSEPSNSDGERRDGFSSQEEGNAAGETRGLSAGAGISNGGPRRAASSLLAARARAGAPPLAYAHSIAPSSDYPRYGYASTGAGAYPSSAAAVDPYAPRGVSSVGHLGSPYMTSLPSQHSSGHPPASSAGLSAATGGSYAQSYSPLQPPMSPSQSQQQHGAYSHHPMGGHYPAYSNLPGLTMPGGYVSSSPSASPIQHQFSGSGGPLSAPPSATAFHHHLNGSSSAVPNGPRHHKSSQSLDVATSANNKTPKPKGGNTSPDKRLPYVRWTTEEDEKLKLAIAQHGQRWESVAKVVGTRSYHQCRQRALLMRRKGLTPGGMGGSGSSATGGGGGGGQQGVGGRGSSQGTGESRSSSSAEGLQGDEEDEEEGGEDDMSLGADGE